MRERNIQLEFTPQEMRMISAYGTIAIVAAHNPQFLKSLALSPDKSIAREVATCCKEVSMGSDICYSVGVKMITAGELRKYTKEC